MRLILVDNCSAAGVARWRGVVARTLVVHNSRPLSYAANMNRILRASTARYTLLLNTDMRFDPPTQCLARMVAFMDAHADCGLAGCRIEHADRGNAFAARRFQTLPIILARRFGLERFAPNVVDRYLYRRCDPQATFDCDWLSGCFLLARRDALADVGPFDERFGKYFEDVDMGLRMRLAGWRVMYHGAANCCHLEQRASVRLFSVDAWRHLAAFARWFHKWGWRPWRSLPALAGEDPCVSSPRTIFPAA